METRGLLAGIVHRDVEYVYDLIPKAKKKVPPVITEDELSLIRGWIMQTFSDDPSLQCLYRCIIELLWDGALRRGELLALNLNSLQGTNLVVQNLPEKFDAVWAKKIGAALKTGERTIPIDKATVQWIHKWKTECRPAEAHKLGHGLLLTNLHPDRLGEPFTINALKWLFNRINHPQFGVQVPGKTLHPHMFRHTFATMALDDDLPLSTIQYYLGHKSINSTQIYTHLADSKVRKDLEAWRKKRQYRYGDLAI
ncbi:tyrosine-type recombinase/integrase [Alicyclobacillus fastidiosus]|uniref:Tyrosine-type recombinase/integrase n=1 Tax=Alicyclobacillus fastidiosus TaxID=392011 RepID=A0ABY6Z9Q2_9BACL|nr:tyrosine-type recombinase/integrase [Alicyclobacillus fastidiosus]WAH39604.1 tyrosine-type recombinase/integrase [Alicyclobacillus fastidiosus]